MENKILSVVVRFPDYRVTIFLPGNNYRLAIRAILRDGLHHLQIVNAGKTTAKNPIPCLAAIQGTPETMFQVITVEG